MADMTDAGNALVTLIAATLYPQGDTAPSLTGDRLLVYQGWPDPVTLGGDLAAGTIHVSIFPMPGDKVTSISQDDDDWEEAADGASAIRELRRQTRLFGIRVWAGGHLRRDAAAAAIDAGLAAVSRMVLADGSVAVLTYDGSVQDDERQQAGIYRRDLFYALNYATTRTMILTPITSTVTDVTPVVNGTNSATVSIVT